MLSLIRGLPGSGKSTLARLMAHDSYSIRIEADDYMISPTTGLYEFRKELLRDAHRWCQETTKIFLLKGNNVYVSNTFTTRSEIQPYLDIADNMDELVMVYKCIGEYGNIHNVPQETLDRMKERWEDYPGEIIHSGN